MPDNIFKILFVIGLILGVVVRLLYASRTQPLTSSKEKSGADGRTMGLEKLLLFLSFLGMLVIPLIYVLTPWLALADYHLPTWAG